MNAFWASENFNAFIRSEPPNYEILARKLYPKMVQFSGSRLLLAQALERPAAGQVQNVSLGSSSDKGGGNPCHPPCSRYVDKRSCHRRGSVNRSHALRP